MNSVYYTFQKLNSSVDSAITWDKLKHKYNTDEESLRRLVSVFSNILSDSPNISKKIVIGGLKGEDLISEIEKIYKVDRRSMYHSRKDDTINMLKMSTLYDGLNDLYDTTRAMEDISQEVFAFAWSVALTNEKFVDILYSNVKKEDKKDVS